MVAVHIQRIVIACDGDECRSAFGLEDAWLSALEARLAAHNAGWRFLPQVRKTGALSTTTSDVCPRCAPTWVSRPIGPKQTQMTHDQARALLTECHEQRAEG